MQFAKLFTVFAVFISLKGVIADGDESSTERLYDTSTFEEMIEAKDHFIKFFAPWCGHCKKLAPVWDQLSDKYNADENSGVIIAKVDCTQETKLCSQHGVTGYPTLKFYRAGEEPIKYKGKRDLDTLDKFVQEQINPQKAEAPQTPEAKHGLYELTEGTFKNHIASGSHFVKFYAPWCGHCKRLAPTWEQLAQGFQHSDDVTIAKVDCTAHRSVCEQHGVKGYPTLKFFKDGVVVDSYKGGRDHVALKEYVSKMTQPSAGGEEGGDATPPPVKLEKAAGDAATGLDSKVLVLTTETFHGEIASGTSLIMFYAPWCPHCQNLAPTWAELAEKFSKNAGVRVAKVDCTEEKELCQKHEIRGYPTILLFQNGQMSEKYSNARTLNDLEKYLDSKLPKEEL